MPGSTLGGVLRTMLAAVLLVLLLPALVVANASEWAARTVVDDQAFATTAGRVMDTPALRQVVADRVTSAGRVRAPDRSDHGPRRRDPDPGPDR